MTLLEIISKLQKGEKIKAKVNPEYNHKNGKKTFTRKLFLQKSDYAELGFHVCVTTPVFKQYFLKESEIVQIL